MDDEASFQELYGGCPPEWQPKPGADRLTLTVDEALTLPDDELQGAFGVVVMNYYARTGIRLVPDDNPFKATRTAIVKAIRKHPGRFATQPLAMQWRR